MLATEATWGPHWKGSHVVPVVAKIIIMHEVIVLEYFFPTCMLGSEVSVLSVGPIGMGAVMSHLYCEELALRALTHIHLSHLFRLVTWL